MVGGSACWLRAEWQTRAHCTGHARWRGDPRADHVYNGGIARSPSYFIIVRNEARVTHIFGQVCEWGYILTSANNILTSVFIHHDGNKCLPRTADILPHLHLDAAATRQSHAVRPDRSDHVAHHGAGTLTRAGRRSPGHSTGFGAK